MGQAAGKPVPQRKQLCPDPDREGNSTCAQRGLCSELGVHNTAVGKARTIISTHLCCLYQIRNQLPSAPPTPAPEATVSSWPVAGSLCYHRDKGTWGWIGPRVQMSSNPLHSAVTWPPWAGQMAQARKGRAADSASQQPRPVPGAPLQAGCRQHAFEPQTLAHRTQTSVGDRNTLNFLLWSSPTSPHPMQHPGSAQYQEPGKLALH